MKANVMTASIAGLSLVGMFELVDSGVLGNPPNGRPPGILVFLQSVYFFLTMFFLVLGRENAKLSPFYCFTKEGWQAFPHVILRIFVWFVSAGLGGYALKSWLRSH